MATPAPPMEEPPFLTVGTDVSAKYKGAFCEAKVTDVDKIVKLRVLFKGSTTAHLIDDDQVKPGFELKTGIQIEARHPGKHQQFVQATITKITDHSRYTVIFDDGDYCVLRRNSLRLKSGKHFAESETLDRLPLTNPEHFGNPVKVEAAASSNLSAGVSSTQVSLAASTTTASSLSPSTSVASTTSPPTTKTATITTSTKTTTVTTSTKTTTTSVAYSEGSNSSSAGADTDSEKGFPSVMQSSHSTTSTSDNSAVVSRKLKRILSNNDSKNDTSTSQSNNQESVSATKRRPTRGGRRRRDSSTRDTSKLDTSDTGADDSDNGRTSGHHTNGVQTEQTANSSNSSARSVSVSLAAANVEFDNIEIGTRLRVEYGNDKLLKVYEAKVLKMDTSAGKSRYYVHYLGWNNRYDEWITSNRIVSIVGEESTKKSKRVNLTKGSNSELDTIVTLASLPSGHTKSSSTSITTTNISTNISNSNTTSTIVTSSSSTSSTTINQPSEQQNVATIPPQSSQPSGDVSQSRATQAIPSTTIIPIKAETNNNNSSNENLVVKHQESSSDIDKTVSTSDEPTSTSELFTSGSKKRSASSACSSTASNSDDVINSNQQQVYTDERPKRRRTQAKLTNTKTATAVTITATNPTGPTISASSAVTSSPTIVEETSTAIISESYSQLNNKTSITEPSISADQAPPTLSPSTPLLPSGDQSITPNTDTSSAELKSPSTSQDAIASSSASSSPSTNNNSNNYNNSGSSNSINKLRSCGTSQDQTTSDVFGSGSTSSGDSPGHRHQWRSKEYQISSFCEPIDEVDCEKKIAILEDRLHALRRIYVSIKSKVAHIERRQKKQRQQHSPRR